MSECNSTSISSPKQHKIKSKLFGVGYNSKGKYKTNTPAYHVWSKMLARCYSSKEQEKRPTYIGCTVSDEWLDFQVFADWYVNHDYYGTGYQVDKDLLVTGNKVYSPDLCCMVPGKINSLILDCAATKGKYPTGVNLHRKKFRAQIRKHGKKKDLGYFDTPEKARQAYIVEKESYVKEVAKEYRTAICDRTYQALLNWKC